MLRLHGCPFYLHANEKIKACRMCRNRRQAVGFVFSRLSVSRPGAYATAVAGIAVEGVGPADILLEFDGQRTDRLLGLVTGTRRTELGGHASDG